MASRFTGGTAFWLASAAGLSGVIALEVRNEMPLASDATAAQAAMTSAETKVPDQPVVSLPSPDLIDEIAARPLLSKSRRPFVAAPELAPAVAKMPERALALELIGTMLKGEARIALLKHPDGRLMRLRRGQSVGDWRIADIALHQVELENGEDVQVLTLRRDLAQPRRSRRQKTDDATAARAGNDEPEQVMSEPTAVQPDDR